MTRSLKTAYEAYWFLYYHPQLSLRTRTPETPKDAAKSRRKGYLITKDKNGQYWREWRHDFHRSIVENFDIYYTLVDSTGKVNDKKELNVNSECWLECGPMEWDYITPWDKGTNRLNYHAVELDCGGPSFDSALIKLAKLVLKHYGDYKLKKSLVQEGKRGRPCADCKWLNRRHSKMVKQLRKGKSAKKDGSH